MKTIAQAIVLFAFLSVAGLAQWFDHPTPGIPRTNDGKPNLSAPAPTDRDGKPDLSGIWMRTRGPNTPAGGGFNLESLTWRMPVGAEVPLRPAAQALFKQHAESFAADRPSGHCLPHGIPDAMVHGGPMKIVQNSGLTIILFEEFNHYRQIFSDGRSHPSDPNPTWFGYSIGKWEGDTFVVESRGFNDKSWLDDIGHPHTDALHTTERFRRRDFGHLEVEVTFDDPKAYTKPWSATIQFNLLPDTELIEDICENEKDAAHLVGK